MSRAGMVAILFTVCILWKKYVKDNWKWILPLFLIATAILYISKAESANGRIFMAIMGCSAWAAAPWIGHGSGSFLHALSCAEANWFATHPDSTIANWAGVAEYPFCEPLKIAVEYGAVGLLLFLGMVVSALICLWKNNNAEFFGLLSLCFFSLFSYPLSLYPFLLAMSVFIMRAIVPENGFSTIKSITYGIIGISIATISANLLKPYYKAKSDYLYLSYNYHPSLIKEYYHMVPFMLENPKFLFSFGKILREEGRYNDSNEMLLRCADVSNDPMVYVLIGRNYEDMDARDLAIQHYLDAFHMQPNRLYPLYRLMKLYQAEGCRSKCLEYARTVSAFIPKLPSPAVTEMQSEANEIITQYENL